MAVEETLFEIKPDMMIFTHNHLDHYDLETAERFIKGGMSFSAVKAEQI